MKELFCQLNRNRLYPESVEDAEILSDFSNNQVVRVKVYGTNKQRSVKQLGLYWACCRLMADNINNQHFNNKDKVNNQIRVALEFIDLNKSIVDKRGTFHPHYRSISFKSLKHLEACNYFDRAFELMAKGLKITVDELVEEAKSRMGGK